MAGFLNFEPASRPLPRWREMRDGFTSGHLANGTVSFLFAATGPVALILSVGFAGGLKTAELASWISIAFGLGALITVAMSFFYRQPLVHAWTISGSAIAGAAMIKFSYDQIVGAYLATGVLMFLLGVSGLFRRLMDWTPQPIVMAMVAGVFLKFGLLAVEAFDKSLYIAIAAAVAFVGFTMVPRLGRSCPPVLAALIAGVAVIVATGQYVPPAGPAGPVFVQLVFIKPVFDEKAIVELLLPLAISVLALQNAQGIALMRLSRHDPPANAITTVCGAGSVAFGLFGAVCTCLTGPANAIIMASGERRDHYLGAFVFAFWALVFALFAPYVTRLAASVPESFIYILGGLAMLRVLQQTFTAAFAGRFAIGALVTFVVTVTELIPEIRVSILGIGAPFWGLVFGIATSLLLERGDFTRKEEAPALVATAAPPPAPPARLTLIAADPTPAALKVRIALLEKKLPHLALPAPPPGMPPQVAINPLGIAPVLVVGENLPVYDARAILDYLESAAPEPRLFPTSLNQTAATRRVEALADAAVDFIGAPEAEAALNGSLGLLAQELGRREFLGGDGFGRADIAAIALLDALSHEVPGHDWRARFPGLEAYWARVTARDSVAQARAEHRASG